MTDLSQIRRRAQGHKLLVCQARLGVGVTRPECPADLPPEIWVPYNGLLMSGGGQNYRHGQVGRNVEGGPVAVGAARLLELDSDLAGNLRGPRLYEATRRTVVDLLEVPRGDWTPDEMGLERGRQRLLVLDGFVLRQCSLMMRGDRQGSAELLGASDVIDPVFTAEAAAGLVPSRWSWRVLRSMRVAIIQREVLDDPLVGREVTEQLQRRLVGRLCGVAERHAFAQIRSLELRLLLLFAQIAERWGRREARGVVLDVPLSQNTIADLACAKRRSISEPLQKLRQAKTLVRQTDSRWVFDPAVLETIEAGLDPLVEAVAAPSAR